MGARASREADDNEDQVMNDDDNAEVNPNPEAQPAPDPPPAPLEPRRHQGGHRDNILNILENLYRSGQLNLRTNGVMPGRRALLR